MSVRPPMKFGFARLTHAHGILQRHRLYPATTHVLFRPVFSGHRARKISGNSGMTSGSKGKWSLHLNLERAQDRDRSISLPLMVYLYSPWMMFSIKFNLWILKLLWDWRFAELQFVDNAKQALVLVTKFIVEQHEGYIKRCTTPMGYKQIRHDLIGSNASTAKLMVFDKRHIRRAIPLKIQRLQHYDHKFAFIDMIFLACRRTNDFVSKQEMQRMQNLVAQCADTSHIFVPNPIIFAEFFVRFRRDYSLPCTERAGHWLISTYKILRLDVLNNHPEFHVGSGVYDIVNDVQPLHQKTTHA
ncbi:PREDICTED: uncharacterized protein LOC108616467 [Drosophila arizonae]|uniref:Uncharacterized protein LOC108616467 n=1 Tax=Drosophila arizonae TaxID=7263 RepID=A0ABM1PIX3_DROAR|nr:PREDICTED: uncharacterized protein LOC108616467 [Drosophila arizonae]